MCSILIRIILLYCMEDILFTMQIETMSYNASITLLMWLYGW